VGKKRKGRGVAEKVVETEGVTGQTIRAEGPANEGRKKGTYMRKGGDLTHGKGGQEIMGYTWRRQTRGGNSTGAQGEKCGPLR